MKKRVLKGLYNKSSAVENVPNMLERSIEPLNTLRNSNYKLHNATFNILFYLTFPKIVIP